MAVLEENLVQGNYYIHYDHGIGQYIGIKYHEISAEIKKYHGFKFKGNDALFVPVDQLINLIECDSDFVMIKGTNNLGGDYWERERKNTMNKYENFIMMKVSLSKTNAYKNILLDGIKNSKSLVIQMFNQKHMYPNLNDYIISALENSDYPYRDTQEIEAEIDTNTQTAIINYRLPNTNELPNITGIKIDAKGNFKETKMKDKEFMTYYESSIFQIALRTIHETFQVTKLSELESIVWNGWVDTVDKRTGANITSCILSIMVSRIQFEKINLELVSPKECVQYLKGVFAAKLHELAPVKPILTMNRNDKRFIDDVEILNEIHEGVNLAEMDWGDFEYLIRELFGKIFSNDGSEVKVTQASRDGGVDAVAFDTDPIRGGKFIIQAKRYNNVVPVSAVRDLYGTVINEGANRGILVTTSYFGNDSREFAKDKPITLIDGANVVYLLSEHGYKSHIKLRKK